jgi:predicted transposase/invertase (TIGR01784 family)
MQTDAFFYQLFKQLPATVFELIHRPGSLAVDYDFTSVELKKALRIDGVMRPRLPSLPVYFVEVQFQLSPIYYANLFAKVFCFLQENRPDQDWAAVAVFGSREHEPKQLTPYEVLLRSRHVHRVYLEDYPIPPDPPVGLGILQLVTAPQQEVRKLVRRLHWRVENEFVDRAISAKVIELTEELLLRRFTQFTRQEIRKMFQLEDIRKSKVWQEAHDEGVEKGLAEGVEKGRTEGVEKGKTLAIQTMVQKCLAKGMPVKDIAELLEIPVKDVRRLARVTSK